MTRKPVRRSPGVEVNIAGGQEFQIEDEYITLARVLKTQGRHGEVAVETRSDAPGRFKPGMSLWTRQEAARESEVRRELEVEHLWPHKELLVIKFAGVDSISQAEHLLGCELQVPHQQRAPLKPGWNYVSDLVGCRVFDSGREIGAVENIEFGAGEAPLLIVKAGSQRHEIPYAEAYLKRIDVNARRIEMRLPEGMLEVNAPLTSEEKLLQQRQNAAGKK
ncbi:MAG: ribosome maturation factor RimM [Terriglobales bacterium]